MTPTPTGWNRIVARLRGEVPAAALEAYRHASLPVLELFEQVERRRLETAIKGHDVAGANASLDRIVAMLAPSKDAKGDKDREKLTSVFAQIETDQGVSVIVASEGRQRLNTETGDREISLYGGWRFDGRPGAPSYDILRFDEFTTRVTPPEFIYTGGKRKLMSTRDLWRSDDLQDRAELHWRIAAPLISWARNASAGTAPPGAGRRAGSASSMPSPPARSFGCRNSPPTSPSRTPARQPPSRQSIPPRR